jgi:hypothetical protein
LTFDVDGDGDGDVNESTTQLREPRAAPASITFSTVVNGQELMKWLASS